MSDGNEITLETLVQYVDEAEEASRTSRHMSERSRDYYDGTQLTNTEVQTLQKRKQPKVVFNRIQPKIDFLLGTERQQRTDPKAFPRTPQHEDAANAVTDAIRFVLDRENFDVKSSDVFENELIEGTGGVSVEAMQRGDEIEIVIKRIRWDRFGYDPHSFERDFSDARYTFVVAWMDLADATARWKDKAEDMTDRMSSVSDTYDDKPNRWYDKRRKRVMFVDMYFMHQGRWHKVIFSKDVILEAPTVSPYVDEDGEPQNTHIMQSAKVKRDGDRYGAVEPLMDIQDEINKRRSKAMHILNSRQTFAKEGHITDINNFKREANKADGHLEFPASGEFGRDFGIVPTSDFVGPQFQMYQEAQSQIDSVSANAALAGKTEGNKSGRALQALQQGGMTELAPLFDGHAQWKRRVYLAVWDRIKQFWTAEKWVRVTDDEENLKFVGLNIPITQAAALAAEKMGISPQEVVQQFPREMDDIHRRAPNLAQVISTANDVAEMHVDIVVEEVPDVVNLQSEQFEALVSLYQANPDGIDFEDIVAMSTLRNKDKILKRDLSPDERAAAEEQAEQRQRALDVEVEEKAATAFAKRAQGQKDLSEAQKNRLELLTELQ